MCVAWWENNIFQSLHCETSCADFQHLYSISDAQYGQNNWLTMDCNECTNRQYMKIYGLIHIHSCYELTPYLNNLHFMQVWKYHPWFDLLPPWGSDEPHHSSCIGNIPHDNTRVMFFSPLICPWMAFYPLIEILFFLMCSLWSKNLLANKQSYLRDAEQFVSKIFWKKKDTWTSMQAYCFPQDLIYCL